MKTIKKERAPLTLKPLALSVALLSASVVATPTMAADTLAEAFSGGKPYVNLRLRYESADQDGVGGRSADALTLDTVFGYQSGEYKGFSFLVEAEDVREVFGVNDFSVPPAGVRNNPLEFDIIADAETTELDQAFIQYKSGGFSTKLGRQVITHDGHRFIGHVGWRQDRQTFDGVTVSYSNDKLALTGSYVTQRNRIFAEEGDINSSDVFLNASYKLGTGKLVAYSYLLENDDNNTENDTYGISYTGATKFGETKVNYTAEYATQDTDTTDADYFNLGAGATFGPIKLSLGYELLGSDSDGGEFTTPLATLHKFNGWADVFILGAGGNGLQDISATLDVKAAGGKFKLAVHDFQSDDTFDNGSDDLGSEVNIQYTRNFGKHIYTGVKYANYSAGDAVSAGLIDDTERFWAWVGFKFK